MTEQPKEQPKDQVKNQAKSPRRLALVLSGGGARGAYEVGVLSNLLPRLAKLGIKVNILVATSVGALNAAALAATAQLAGEHGARLQVGLLRRGWESIDQDQIFSSRFLSALFALPLHLTNVRGPHLEALLSQSSSLRERMSRAFNPRPYRYRALYDTSPLSRTLRDGTLIDWKQLQENLERGYIESLAMSATCIQTGETVVFTQSQRLQEERWIRDERLRLVPAKIDHRTALASAAMPFLFPPQRLPLPGAPNGGLFFDGGIRLNTPLLPAILLGADSILVIGLHHIPEVRPALVESPSFEVIPILGKILNAFFLDRVRTDFNRLAIMNKLINNADPEKLAQINQERAQRGKDPLREIRALEQTPSRDLGELTAELWERRPDLHRPPWRWMFDARGLQGSAFGDLLSYIFFHPEFTRTLIELGEQDAAREMKDDDLRWLGGVEGESTV